MRRSKQPQDMRRTAAGQQLERELRDRFSDRTPARPEDSVGLIVPRIVGVIGTNYHVCTACGQPCDAKVHERIGAPQVSSCCSAPLQVAGGRD